MSEEQEAQFLAGFRNDVLWLEIAVFIGRLWVCVGAARVLSCVFFVDVPALLTPDPCYNIVLKYRKKSWKSSDK